MQPSLKSLELLQKVSTELSEATMHHLYHILMDIAWSYQDSYNINFLEIGTAYGVSSSFMLQRPYTNIVTLDNGMMGVPEELVQSNLHKSNIHNNNFKFIIGDSHDERIADIVKVMMPKVDILFIDGDHSVEGVKKDFYMYSDLVVKGGYIVFDDYGDYRYTPTVKVGVDQLLNDLQGYEIIGMPKNTFGARPIDYVNGNELILRKI